MPTAQKARVIEETGERFQRSKGVLFTEYRGLKVKELQLLRKQLGEKGGELQVVKNTLFGLAAGEGASPLTETLKSGPTAVVFLYENESDCAKVVMDFAKTHKSLVVKGGLINGKVFDGSGVEELSKLPPRDVLISQIIGLVAAPIADLVGVIEALYADPIRVIGAVADKVAEGSPLPEADAPTAAAEEPAAAEAAAEPTTEPAAEAAAEAPTAETEAAPEAEASETQE
ncbi:MAG: 50S ribosomal protein L10 [Fimbriimonadaceae bacterium]|nr:50S ribosomal protein L10 [Fimbriimonadaceae bacterium]